MIAIWWALVFLAYSIGGAFLVVLMSIAAFVTVAPWFGVAVSVVLTVSYLVGIVPIANWTIERSL